MSGWGYFFLVLLILVILIPAGWILYTRIRASRSGLPPPPWSSYLRPFSKSHQNDPPSSRIYPASRSPLDWFKEKLSSLRGGRSGGGAYEPTGGRRGLAPDEAWDARVGGETDPYGGGGGGGYDYEEQELGLHYPPSASGASGAVGAGGTAYTGAGTLGRQQHGGDEEMHAGMPRGRSLSRDDDGMDERYDDVEEYQHPPASGRGRGEDPFGDGAERSELRGVSPRPIITTHDNSAEGALKPGGGKAGDLSPTERRSMFRENM